MRPGYLWELVKILHVYETSMRPGRMRPGYPGARVQGPSSSQQTSMRPGRMRPGYSSGHPPCGGN